MAKMIQVPYDYTITLPVTTAQAVQANNENPISLEALGLLVNLLSYPSTWELHKTELYKRFGKNGRTSVNSAWKDLMNANYIIEFKYRNGKKYDYVYYFRKVPFSDEEKAKILADAEKEHGAIWAVDFVHSKMETSKPTDNKKHIFNKDPLLNKEEEEVSPHSELISFLLSKDITLEDAKTFEKRLTEEGVTGYTNDDVIEAIGLSLQDFVDGVCNSPYLWAVRKLKYILDSKTKAVGKKNNSNKLRDKKVTRKEKLPNWFKENEKRDVQDEPSLSTPTDPEQKKQEIERMLQQLRD